MLFALILSLLGGCVRVPKNIGPKPSASQSDSEDKTTAENKDSDTEAAASGTVAEEVDNSSDESSAPVSLAPATNPSEGFSNYSTYKGNAYDRITKAAEGSDSLSMTVSMGYLGVTMVDLSLIPITMLVGDPQTSQAAMAVLFTDAKITGNGNNFTITYKDSEGAAIKQTCQYDPGKDQMTSTLYDADGKISIFFEYVKVGDAYAAQYYYPQEGGYQVIRSYFDKDNVAAFGILSATAEPASILGQTGFGADFVKNDENYMILKDGKLTVFDKGNTTTN